MKETFRMACANADLSIQTVEEVPMNVVRNREPGVTRQYQAQELVQQSKKNPLQDLQQKQAVLGSLQVMSGLLSVGVGILLAVTQDMRQSLFCLFRVSQMTGALFMIAGFVSNLLAKNAELLPVSLMINCGCLSVALAAAPLIIVDLSMWDTKFEQALQLEIFELCVLVLESCTSVVLCFWFVKEKRKFSL